MDKRRIDFAVSGQEITFSMADPIPRGDTQQYLTAHFSVDEAWAGLSLQAVFGRKGRGFSPVTVSLDETMACDFPPSLLTAPDGGGTVYVRVGLIGTDMKGVRLTTGCAAVPVAPSCYVRGETPKDPPQDVYAKLLGEMGAKLDANQGAANAGKVLAIDENGEVVPMETPSGGGVAEEKDPTVPAWAKQPEKPAYTADEVGAISQGQLDRAVNQALAQAKESGEFDGDPGATGPQGPKGDPYTLTEADKAEIAAAVIERLGGNPIFGYVDEDNNIIVQGDLADGTYSVKYEMENGNVINIGNMVLDSNVYYSVTSTLTNCTNSNSTKTVVKGGSYAATITAKDGYELKSLTVTMGGSPVSVSGGSISIANVTGDIVITAVAEEAKAAYTNILTSGKYTIEKNKRWSNSSKGYTTCNGMIAMVIPIADVLNKTIYFKGFPANTSASNSAPLWMTLDSSNSRVSVALSSDGTGNIWKAENLTTYENDVYGLVVNGTNFADGTGVALAVNMAVNSGTSISEIPADAIMTIDEPIV